MLSPVMGCAVRFVPGVLVGRLGPCPKMPVISCGKLGLMGMPCPVTGSAVRVVPWLLVGLVSVAALFVAVPLELLGPALMTPPPDAPPPEQAQEQLPPLPVAVGKVLEGQTTPA